MKYLTFLYHEVVDDPSESGFQRKSALPYKHKVQEYYDNIDIIVKNSNNITTINDLGGEEEVTLITFDDGGKSAMLAADYLEQNSIRGHFFITTSLIGDKFFLSEDQILELHKRGHIIGSHSHTHPNVFKSLSLKEMQHEWSESKAILERILGTEVTSCSIPGGDANRDAYISAKECGYKYIFDSEPIVKERKVDDALVLGRICPKTGTDYKQIKLYCSFKGIKAEALKRKTKNLIKTIAFPIYSKLYNAMKHEGE